MDCLADLNRKLKIDYILTVETLHYSLTVWSGATPSDMVTLPS